MFHKHNWSRWRQELRPLLNDHQSESYSIKREYDVMFNVRKCEGCGLVQEKKAEM